MTIDGIRYLAKILMNTIGCNEEKGIIKTGHTQVCIGEINKLYELINSIEVSLKVVEPTIFSSLLISTLFCYFIIWIPYSLWATLSYWASVVVYTIIMFILTTVYLIRNWLGDPFDPNRPIKTVYYDEWKRDAIKRICNNYKEFASDSKIKN